MMPESAAKFLNSSGVRLQRAQTCWSISFLMRQTPSNIWDRMFAYPVGAVRISSVVFGVWHVLPAITWHESNAGIAESLGDRHERARWIVVSVSVAGTTLAGIIFCMLRIWSDSLLAPMAFHWAINGLGLFFVWWLRRR